jgi:hypothetical protein
VPNPRMLRDIAGKLRLSATELEIQAEEIEESTGKDALAVMERSCQGKRAYATAEGAGQAAADRGVPNLRVYKCTFCQEYHLSKSALGQFAERNG